MVMSGTHKGAWLGIPATEKSASMRLMTVHRIQGGKVVEDWVLVESLGLFQQLGLLPSTKDFVADFVRAPPRKWFVAASANELRGQFSRSGSEVPEQQFLDAIFLEGWKGDPVHAESH
jgi:hypothetical protein